MKSEPTEQDVRELLGVNGQKPGGSGFLEVPCPICGSDTGFSIVVEPEKTRRGIPTGFWRCLSSKHPEPSSGHLGMLRRMIGGASPLHVVGAPRESRERIGPTERPDPKSPIKYDILGKKEHRKVEEYASALQDNEPVLNWLWKKFRMTREEAASMSLGFSDRRVMVGKGDKSSPCKSWLTIPYFDHQGCLIQIKSRAIPPFPKRSYLIYPKEVAEGHRGEFMPYNAQSLPLMLDDEEQSLIIVEGESDTWTLRKVFGPQACVVGIAGADKTPEILCRILKKFPPYKDVPRIIVVHDRDDKELRFCRELIRRVGAKYFLRIVPPDDDPIEVVKDVTDLYVNKGWRESEFKEWFAKAETVTPMGSSHITSVVGRMIERRTETSEGLRFHLPCDAKWLASPWLKHPHLEAGRVSVLMGPRKHRKTALALRASALSSGDEIDPVPGAFICLEQPMEQTMEQLFPILMRQKISGDYEMRRQQLMAFQNVIYKSRLYLSNDMNMTFRSWRELVHDMVSSLGIRFVVVDSLTRIGGAGDERDSTVNAWCNTAKSMASDLGIHIMFLAHVTPPMGNENYEKPLGNNCIRYYRDVLSIVDYSFILQCKERPGVQGTGVVSACSLFQKGLSRGPSAPPVELLWDEFQSPTEVPGAFLNNLDISDIPF